MTTFSCPSHCFLASLLNPVAAFRSDLQSRKKMTVLLVEPRVPPNEGREQEIGHTGQQAGFRTNGPQACS